MLNSAAVPLTESLDTSTVCILPDLPSEKNLELLVLTKKNLWIVWPDDLKFLDFLPSICNGEKAERPNVIFVFINPRWEKPYCVSLVSAKSYLTIEETEEFLNAEGLSAEIISSLEEFRSTTGRLIAGEEIQVCTVSSFQGPGRSIHKEILSCLEEINHCVPIHEFRRDWDTRLFPLSTKGFYSLKKKIPEALKALNIAFI